MYSQSPYMPRPRFPMCVAPLVVQKKCHSSRPSRASIAQALSGAETYRSPFTSRMEPLMVEPPYSIVPTPPTLVCPPPRPPRPAPLPPVTRVSHDNVRCFTVERLTCVSALNRLPE